MSETGARPTVPVLDGEGVGPEVVKAARKACDAAAAKAYGAARKIEWLPVPQGRPGEALPEPALSAVQRHKVLLRGPLGQPRGGRLAALERGLDLHLADVRTGVPGLRLLVECADAAAGASELLGGAAPTQDVLMLLKKELPGLSASIRFGSRERLESYLRSIGRRDPALLETGLSLELTSREGSERFVEAGIAKAKALGLRQVTVVVDPATSPVAASAFLDSAYRAASERHPGTYTWLDHARAATRFGRTVADEARETALKESLYVERRDLAEVLDQAWKSPESLGFLLMPWSEGLALAGVLLASRGGPAAGAIARTHPATGAFVAETMHGTAEELAGKDKANPAGAMRAGALVLERVGFGEAAGLVEKALAKVAAKAPATCAAYADAVVDAISR